MLILYCVVTVISLISQLVWISVDILLTEGFYHRMWICDQFSFLGLIELVLSTST